MVRWKRLTTCFILVLLAAFTLTPAVFANSAEPPGVTIIVSNPPEDLTLSIRFVDGNMTGDVQLQKEQKAWEAYYRFFYWMPETPNASLEGATLLVHSSQKSFECPLPSSVFGRYNNLLTLDMESESVTEGQSKTRPMLLVSMRVAFTLLIEGLIFLAFGYRQKLSWITFVIVNLLTQGALNIALSGPSLGSYWMFGFVVYEIIVFAVEAVAFALILREFRKGRAIAFALTANFASLILGGLLIAYLPV